MAKHKSKLNLIINTSLLIMIIAVSYSWMVTVPSRGEIVNYDRRLIVPSTDLIITPYIYDEEAEKYVVSYTSPMQMELTEPGKVQKYKFDIVNNQDIDAKVNIVFSNITGNITDLQDKVFIGSTNQKYLFEKSLSSLLEFNNGSNTYYIKLVDGLKIPANSGISFYWYTYVDQYASNEISNMSINIDKIIFNQ